MPTFSLISSQSLPVVPVYVTVPIPNLDISWGIAFHKLALKKALQATMPPRLPINNYLTGLLT